MGQTLEYIANKYHFDFSQKSPFLISEGRGAHGLAGLFNELGFKKGVEVGVQKGEYTKVLGSTIPGLTLYGVDAWTAYDGYSDIRGGQETYEKNYETAKARTTFFNCVLIKKWSLDAAKDFADNSLDFVYLDANHEFQHVTNDIAAWTKKIRPGGIISGHDFARINGRRLKIHVKDVVEAWTTAHGIHPWFVFTGDSSPNWMWVKE